MVAANDKRFEFISMPVALARINYDIQYFTIGNRPYLDSVRTAFLKPVYKGAITLYQYVGKKDDAHYFIQKGDRFTEIYNHQYLDSGDFHGRRTVIKEYKQYIDTLKSFTSDCPEIHVLLENLEMNEQHLIQMLRAYDNCRERSMGKMFRSPQFGRERRSFAEIRCANSVLSVATPSLRYVGQVCGELWQNSV